MNPTTSQHLECAKEIAAAVSFVFKGNEYLELLASNLSLILAKHFPATPPPLQLEADGPAIDSSQRLTSPTPGGALAALSIANRSADDQMQQKREAQRDLAAANAKVAALEKRIEHHDDAMAKRWEDQKRAERELAAIQKELDSVRTASRSLFEQDQATIAAVKKRMEMAQHTLGYVVEYGKRAGMSRVIQVCEMTLAGEDLMDVYRAERIRSTAQPGEGTPC